MSIFIAEPYENWSYTEVDENGIVFLFTSNHKVVGMILEEFFHEYRKFLETSKLRLNQFIPGINAGVFLKWIDNIYKN